MVVPREDQRALSDLERELENMKVQLTELDAHYTREYLARQPGLRALPEQIAALEREVAHKKEVGQQAVLADAQQAYIDERAKPECEPRLAELEKHDHRFAIKDFCGHIRTSYELVKKKCL